MMLIIQSLMTCGLKLMLNMPRWEDNLQTMLREWEGDYWIGGQLPEISVINKTDI